MKKGYTDITVVLDRSGSMGMIRESTIEAMNGFIAGQKEAEGECTFTLNQFDDHHEVVYLAENIQKVQELTEQTFVPRGSTALYDAICLAIEATGKRLRELPENQRPENVMFVIMTDGEENSSKKFNINHVNEMISHQRDKYNWDFVFLGANQDAIATGAKLGIWAGKSMTFNTSDMGVKNAVDSINAYYSSVRSCQVSANNFTFSAEDRAKAMEK